MRRIVILLLILSILLPMGASAIDSANNGEWTDALFIQNTWTAWGGSGPIPAASLFSYIRLRDADYWKIQTPAALKYYTKVGSTNIYPLPSKNSSAITDVRLENSSGYLISYATVVYSIDFSNNAYVAVFFHDFDNDALISTGTEDLTFDWSVASEPDPNVLLSTNYQADASSATPNPPDWEQSGMTLTRYNPTCSGCSIVVEYNSGAQILYFRIPHAPYDEFDIARVSGETQITIEHQNITDYTWTIDLDGSGTNNLIGILSPNGTPQRLSVENPVSGHGRSWSWAGAVLCNFTAAVQNTEDGNVVSGATFKIWDVTKNTWQSFVLPYGIGPVSISYFGDTYAFNATKTGYVGFDADPPGGMVLDSCPTNTIYTYLSGPPSVAGNATVHFFVTNPDALAIPNAQVCLNNGMCGSTNLAGTTTFPLLIIGQDYNYSVTKIGYYGAEGSFTGAVAPQIVEVTLTEGIIPTATITPTPIPTKVCVSGDLACRVGNSLTMVGDSIEWIAGILLMTLYMTLLTMFIFVTSFGLLHKWQGGKRGGGRGNGIYAFWGRRGGRGR